MVELEVVALATRDHNPPVTPMGVRHGVKMTTYYTSDWHLGDPRAPKRGQRHKYCRSLEDMENMLIRRHNEIVEPEDTVYHLGDVGLAHLHRIGEFHGNFKLVVGNWDEANLDTIKLHMEVIPELIVCDHDERLIMCHYPIWDWPNKYKGWIHLHGHLHSRGEAYQPQAIDVGVDNWDMRPVTLDSIRTRIKER